ncbi:MAG TPA: hypothetical protein VE913_05650 [Longimicrobium sp.]|nr:hypothetical protein [Longimicrobium sp.]
MAMIDGLVKEISERTGLPHDKAEQAARAAIDFLDGRLPPPIGGNLHRLIGEGGAQGTGGAAGAGGLPDLGNIAGSLGGLFGKK